MPCRCVPAVDILFYCTPTDEGRQAQQFLDRRGVAYEVLDITTDPMIFEEMKALSGQTARPVIVVNDEIFVGFDPDEMIHILPSMH